MTAVEVTGGPRDSSSFQRPRQGGSHEDKVTPTVKYSVSLGRALVGVGRASPGAPAGRREAGGCCPHPAAAWAAAPKVPSPGKLRAESPLWGARSAGSRTARWGFRTSSPSQRATYLPWPPPLLAQDPGARSPPAQPAPRLLPFEGQKPEELCSGCRVGHAPHSALVSDRLLGDLSFLVPAGDGLQGKL